MSTEPPIRPKGDTIDVTDSEAVRAWAAWLSLEEAAVVRLVGIVGSSAGQIEFILGIREKSRW